MKLYAVQNGGIHCVSADENAAPFQRVDDGHHGWREYHAMYEKTGDVKYKACAEDEFTHAASPLGLG
jgi:hypothetical protein